jgi:hypothetical protein
MKKMNTSWSRRLAFFALIFFVSGCANKPADFCKLLTMQEVRKLHPEAVVAKMEEWYKSTDHPTWYCSWKDGKDNNLLSLSVSFATSNSSVNIARAFGGGSQVVETLGVGKDSAAWFYKDKENGASRLTFLARDDKWSLDIRSSIVGDEEAEQFQIIKEIANKTFLSLATDKVFSKIKK